MPFAVLQIERESLYLNWKVMEKEIEKANLFKEDSNG
jgi:hypothetical protein